MARSLRRLVVGGVVIAGLVALAAWWLGREEVVEVEVVTVESGRVEETVTNSRAGTVEARLRSQLSPDSGGRVTSLPRREGARVRAGEVLLELDPALERGEVVLRERDRAAARAERDRACLAAERAARELERNRRLAAEQILAVDLLDRVASATLEAEAACAAARAVEERSGAALALAREALDRRTLRAPFDGVLAEVSTEVGEFITPAPPGVPIPAVMDLLDPASIYLSLPMDEVDAGRLRAGLPVRATVDSRAGEHFAARVSRVAPYVLDVQAQNRTVEIEVELDEPAVAETLLPGTSADVEVVLEAREGVLRIPSAAVLSGDRVLVVEGARLVEKRIETGLRNWDFTEIRAGLAAGEQVVTSLDRPEVSAGARARVRAGGDARTSAP